MELTVVQPMQLRLKLTAIYGCMVILGAFIMLLVMTFNVGILAAVVLGQTIGYAIMPEPIKINTALLHDLTQTTSVYRPEYDNCCTHCEE